MNAHIPALDTLVYTFEGTRASGVFKPVLVGVVGSGNLEVLAEPIPGQTCQIHITTSARGFAPIWEAVLGDFHQRHALAGVRLSLNDMGATPAVVSLRLDQVVAQLQRKADRR